MRENRERADCEPEGGERRPATSGDRRDDDAGASADGADEECEREGVGRSAVGDDGEAVVPVGQHRQPEHDGTATDGEVRSAHEHERETDRREHEQGDAPVAPAVHG